MIIDDPNSDLRNNLIKAMTSQNPQEVEKAANEFEAKADKTKLLPEDKELLESAKNLAKSENGIWPMYLSTSMNGLQTFGN